MIGRICSPVIAAAKSQLAQLGVTTASRNWYFNSVMAPLHDVDVPTKKATFSMACFWEPDAIFGAKKGVIRTRVGYAGGTKDEPSYKSIGDHTETIDIDYDPTQISYDQLLEMFWKHHDPTAKTTRQYTSFVFYHDDEQKALAEATLKEKQQQTKAVIVTQVKPAGKFYNAEFYHQKYRLQQHSNLMDAIGLKQGPQLLTSHVAARLNGYVVGFGGVQQFEEERNRLGLDDDKIADYIKKLIIRFEGRGPTC